MNEHPETVSEVGEEALIRRIVERIAPPPPDELWAGDDAAVIRPAAGPLVYTTDLMVEGVDFDRAYCTGADIGWKIIAVNASDCAAMGARPTHALCTLELPFDTPVSVVDGLAEGLVEASERWQIGVVGGDISSGAELSVSVAMLGSPYADVVRRNGARPGDAICVTGRLGGSGAGMKALQRGLAGPGPTEGRSLPAILAQASVAAARRHLRPQARVAEAEAIVDLSPSSMIDVSDGLAVDLGRLMDASGTGCAIDPTAVPIADELAHLAGVLDLDPLEAAMLGGEDFELLFTVGSKDAQRVDEVEARTGTPVTIIGRVTDDGCLIGDTDIAMWKERGWEHLRSR